MSTEEKYVRLLENLLKATEEGRIHWETTARTGTYRVSLGQGMVRIGLIEDPLHGQYGASLNGEESNYQLVLLDQSGRAVDSVSQIPDRPDLLENLYNLARRDALKVDNFIDLLLKDVEKSA